MMSPEIFKKVSGDVFSIFMDKTETVKFFGGEPLINFSLICYGYEYLKRQGFSGKFEIGTNGTFLDREMAEWLAARPDIQVNVNASFGWNKEAGIIKNAIWNFCISPDNPEETLNKLYILAPEIAVAGHRVNLLPAAYCEWLPLQLRRLDFVLEKCMKYLDKNNISLENKKRTGSIPLFNDGPAADCDGTVYSSNLCLADIPEKIKEKIILVPGDKNYYPGPADLIEIYGRKKIVSTYAAGEILNKYVCR